ncbi:MAG: diol dehydratase small subunit [Lachnospiraceae bacterium]|nr:diol dehydratase small subunit [Lachnospiraceae bacterium]
MRYPFGQYETENITSRTGKKLTEITLDAVKEGNIVADDIKISKEVLHAQGEVSLEAGNEPMKRNFDRAAEMVDIPDEILLEMYNKLRPNRATKLELVTMAQTLLDKYNAKNCARLVMEAVEIYEKRGILL